jgi:cytochrome c biogenesis protein CcdA
MDVAQLTLAFMAGALAFLSPCSLPMLPVYISYYIDKSDSRGRILPVLTVAASLIFGFLLVFVVVGIIPSLLLSEFLKLVWVLEPTIGIILIVIGLLTGWTKAMDRLPTLTINGTWISFLSFGVAYGFASLGCNLPIFLLVIFQGATVTGVGEILTLFAAYGAGAAALIIPLTLTLSLAKGLVHKQLVKILPYIKKINGFVLILAGAYMLYAGLTR